MIKRVGNKMRPGLRVVLLSTAVAFGRSVEVVQRDDPMHELSEKVRRLTEEVQQGFGKMDPSSPTSWVFVLTEEVKKVQQQLNQVLSTAVVSGRSVEVVQQPTPPQTCENDHVTEIKREVKIRTWELREDLKELKKKLLREVKKNGCP